MFPGTQPQDGVLALLNGPCRLSLTEQAIQSSRMDTARLPPQWPKEQSSVGAGVAQEVMRAMGSSCKYR